MFLPTVALQNIHRYAASATNTPYFPTCLRGLSGFLGMLWWCVPLSLFAQTSAVTSPLLTTAPATASDTLRLRPLAELLKSALQNAPELHANRTDLAKQTLVAEVQRKSWADVFNASGAAYYGTGNINEIRSVGGTDSNYATGRLGSGINLTLGMKLSGGDLATRRQKTQIQVLQLDRLQSERQMIENQLRDEVAAQYFPLENMLQTVRLRAEALETLHMARTVAEGYFQAGNLPVGEFTTLLLLETKAQEEFLKAQSEAKQRAARLENLTNAVIWNH